MVDPERLFRMLQRIGHAHDGRQMEEDPGRRPIRENPVQEPGPCDAGFVKAKGGVVAKSSQVLFMPGRKIVDTYHEASHGKKPFREVAPHKTCDARYHARTLADVLICHCSP
jgi:hypothetical protein